VLIGTEQKTSFDRWFPSVEVQSGKPEVQSNNFCHRSEAKRKDVSAWIVGWIVLSRQKEEEEEKRRACIVAR
jgi:hypothetical protein